MRRLYSFVVRAYHNIVATAARFGNRKAILWINGRRNLPTSNPDNSKWVWFHVSSLGEFEQGRPLIETIKKLYPDIKILLSFFSPSGYEIRKNYPLADEVLYLPTDTPQNAETWVKRHRFIAAYFVKYDFWFNYIKSLHDNNIPLFFISVTLSPKQYFFKWYGKWFLRQLKLVKHFYTQDDETTKLLNKHGISQATTCGDTRFDRVADIAHQARPFDDIENFINGRKCIIAGSTWPSDEKLIARWLSQKPNDFCMIIAPHDISESHIQQITTTFKDAQLYSELRKDTDILIINTIGILSQLYQYAYFAYIGGGFGSGIHNIQEAVTFGSPVVFGPKHTKFVEATDLVERKGAFAIKNQKEFDTIFNKLIHDNDARNTASKVCLQYVKSKLGATKTIMDDFKDLYHQYE